MASVAMEEATRTAEPTLVVTPKHRDAFGIVFGILVFFGGVGLLLLTFKLAYQMFTTPPESALGIAHGQEINLAKAGDSAAGLVLKVILLIVMALVGSLISNRGIALYHAGVSGSHHPPKT